MNRFFLSMLFVVCGVLASAQTPIVRAKLVPAKGIIVGQPVHLVVEILAPNFFTGSPAFPTFDLDNAIVVLPEETPEHLNEQIKGQSYAGIRRTYLLYPQQPGLYRLPSVQLTIPYAKNPPNSTVVNSELPQLAFHADIPAAAQGLEYFLPTTHLTLQQQWSSPISKLRVGDTVERTLTVTAVRMQGMLIPPLPLEAPSGIRIYPEEPKVQDQKTDRGEFIFGRRIQSAKYLIQKAGDYTLPGIDLQWWSLTSNRLVTATLPAIHFTAAPNPNYTAELPPEPEIVAPVQPMTTNIKSRFHRWVGITLVVVPALLAVWIVSRYARPLGRYIKRKSEERSHSEPAYFRTLVRACKHGDPHETYTRLLRWLGRSRSQLTLSQFLKQSDDDELAQQIDALTESLYAKAPAKTWDGRILAERLRKHRHATSLSLRRHLHLPLLNPYAQPLDNHSISN